MKNTAPHIHYLHYDTGSSRYFPTLTRATAKFKAPLVCMNGLPLCLKRTQWICDLTLQRYFAPQFCPTSPNKLDVARSIHNHTTHIIYTSVPITKDAPQDQMIVLAYWFARNERIFVQRDIPQHVAMNDCAKGNANIRQIQLYYYMKLRLDLREDSVVDRSDRWVLAADHPGHYRKDPVSSTCKAFLCFRNSGVWERRKKRTLQCNSKSASSGLKTY